MEIYRLTTKIDRLEWKGEEWEDVRISWHVDPVTRQFAVSLDDIRNWSKMSTSEKRAVLIYLWAHFQEDEVHAFSAFVASRFDWPIQATEISLPFRFRVDSEIGNASNFVEFIDDETYSLPFQVAGAIVKWKNDCPLGGQVPSEEELDSTDYRVPDDIPSKKLEGFDREIQSELRDMNDRVSLVQQLLAASGHSRAESFEITKELNRSLQSVAEKGGWQ